MLVVGSDINGDNDNGQFRYIAIVLGTDSAINTLFNKIGLRTIEMKHLKKNQRRMVAKTMNFTSNNFLALCLKVDRQKLIDYITTHPHSKAKFMEKKQVYRYFDNIVLSLIRNRIDGFCQHHGTRIGKLRIQCDPDMTKTILNWDLVNLPKGRAHEFADAVSFCYEHKWTPIKGCKYFDYSENIKHQLQKCFMK